MPKLQHNYARLNDGIIRANRKQQSKFDKGNYSVIKKKLQALVFVFVLSLAIPINALARDVANEQYMMTVAQKNYDNAQAELDNATLTLKKQEKVLAQEQLLLKKEQEKQSAAMLKLNKAKEQLERQQKALEEAWNKDSH